jgi:hypothetical protein
MASWMACAVSCAAVWSWLAAACAADTSPKSVSMKAWAASWSAFAASWMV